jgi:hypothetical protein
MDQREQAQFVTAVFTAMCQEQQNRLIRGQARRRTMHDALARGDMPDSYRAQWIREQSSKLVTVLREVAEEFNRTHADDRCSSLDIRDILATVAVKFE